MSWISRISLRKLVAGNTFIKSSKPPIKISISYFSNLISPSQSNSFILPISKFHYFLPQISSSPVNHSVSHGSFRNFSSKSDFDTNKEIDEINLKFAQAREEIELALESKETVYYNEEAECARDAAKEVLDKFEGLMAKLPENEKGVLQRSMGLKMEQLKAELAQLDD